MSYLRILSAIFLLLGVCPPVMALSLQEGMHGMHWNAPISESDHLTKVRESDSVTYYVHSDTLYPVADQMVTTVVYGFYKGRFFAAYIKLGSPLQFNNLKRHFSGKYGKPKVERNAADQLTVLRWKAGEINIKLKMKASGQDVKMAVYYVPLAGDLNRAQVEDIPPELYEETVPKGEPTGKPKPLVD